MSVAENAGNIASAKQNVRFCICNFVIPAKAGIQSFLAFLDSRLRGNDKKKPDILFCARHSYATVSFDDYMERLHCSAKKKGVPVEAMIELTYGCNLNCLHCYNPTHLARNETDTSQILSILSQLAKLGTCLVTFTGGEIFSRKDIFEILDHTRQKGMQFILLTNATLITEVTADRLKQLDPYRVCVSLYGATAETYEKVTRVRGSFKKFVRGLDLLLRQKFPVELRSIILNTNLHEFEALRRFTEKLRLRFDYASEINPRLDGSREPLQHRISPEEDLKLWCAFHGNNFLKKMARVSSPCKSTTQGPFNCRCGKSSLVITPYGKMNLCLFNTFPQENILESSVAAGWKSLVNLVQKSKPTKDYVCTSCSVFDYCARGPSDSFSEMGDVNTCVPYQKEKAVLKKKYVEGVSKNPDCHPEHIRFAQCKLREGSA